jgi:hypothetical protein
MSRLIVHLALRLHLIAVRLVLRLELEIGMSGSKEHLASVLLASDPVIEGLIDIPDLDPILVIVTTHQCLQLISALVRRRPVLNVRWQVLQQAERHITT